MPTQYLQLNMPGSKLTDFFQSWKTWKGWKMAFWTEAASEHSLAQHNGEKMKIKVQFYFQVFVHLQNEIELHTLAAAMLLVNITWRLDFSLMKINKTWQLIAALTVYHDVYLMQRLEECFHKINYHLFCFSSHCCMLFFRCFYTSHKMPCLKIVNLFLPKGKLRKNHQNASWGTLWTKSSIFYTINDTFYLEAII